MSGWEGGRSAGPSPATYPVPDVRADQRVVMRPPSIVKSAPVTASGTVWSGSRAGGRAAPAATARGPAPGDQISPE